MICLVLFACPVQAHGLGPAHGTRRQARGRAPRDRRGFKRIEGGRRVWAFSEARGFWGSPPRRFNMFRLDELWKEHRKSDGLCASVNQASVEATKNYRTRRDTGKEACIGGILRRHRLGWTSFLWRDLLVSGMLVGGSFAWCFQGKPTGTLDVWRASCLGHN